VNDKKESEDNMMTITDHYTKRVLAVLFAGLLVLMTATVHADTVRLNVLLVDGQNNHNWVETSPVIQDSLEKTGRFQVDRCTSPEKLPKKPQLKKEDKDDPSKVAAWQTRMDSWKQDVARAKQENAAKWLKWRPAFSDYDVVVTNYNGQSWPKDVEKEFEKYMRQGGGLVVVHAADNAFSGWEEYNKMIGIGGWGGRNEESGPMLRYRNGQWVHDRSPGRGGMHGKQVAAIVVTHEPNHPIMKGLPPQWMHVSDEIYGKMRGPAENLTVLASSFSDEKDQGTGEQEPSLMVIDYHKGRVFHTIYGHAGKQMKGLGFQTTLQRGTEWAATGSVTLPLPKEELSETVAVTVN